MYLCDGNSSILVAIQHRVKHAERVGWIPSTKITGDGHPDSFVNQRAWVTRIGWAEPTLRCEAVMEGEATSHRLACMMAANPMGQKPIPIGTPQRVGWILSTKTTGLDAPTNF